MRHASLAHPARRPQQRRPHVYRVRPRIYTDKKESFAAQPLRPSASVGYSFPTNFSPQAQRGKDAEVAQRSVLTASLSVAPCSFPAILHSRTTRVSACRGPCTLSSTHGTE